MPPKWLNRKSKKITKIISQTLEPISRPNRVSLLSDENAASHYAAQANYTALVTNQTLSLNNIFLQLVIMLFIQSNPYATITKVC
jgi:hypothetical protein